MLVVEIRVEHVKIGDALRELLPRLEVVLEEALVTTLLHTILQEAADMLLEKGFGLVVEAVRKRLGISHAERVDV